MVVMAPRDPCSPPCYSLVRALARHGPSGRFGQQYRRGALRVNYLGRMRGLMADRFTREARTERLAYGVTVR